MKSLKKILILLLVFFLFVSVAPAQSYTLLVNGQEAFPQIIECIQNAERSIYVNMFIWRDDEIGNVIASELLSAADRGVHVTVSNDLYGSVCEHAEESGTSFFHKNPTFAEKVKISTLKIMYHPAIERRAKDSESDVYLRFMNHDNITVEDSVFKADHSKFYIFDDEVLILGGINIEDKENGSDMSGRVYQDYMIKLHGRDYVELFNSIRNNGITENIKNTNSIYFGINRKFSGKYRIFDMETMYLDVINDSQENLTIVMAYFSPLKNFVHAITDAADRGVQVTVVIPERANFQNDSNKKTMKQLMKGSDSQIMIFFSPKMLHTKLVANEKVISFGSCNITKKAFNQLDELNVFITSDEEELYSEIMESVNETIEESRCIQNSKDIKYNFIIAFLESLLV